MSSSRIPVAVVGATGLAGQQFLASLAGHPLFEAKKLVASARSAGKTFADAIKDDKGASKWFCRQNTRDSQLHLCSSDKKKCEEGRKGTGDEYTPCTPGETVTCLTYRDVPTDTLQVSCHGTQAHCTSASSTIRACQR